jgi:RNA polymerase sigma factor (sigma-70 family)
VTTRAVLATGRLAGRPILRVQSDHRLVDLVRSGCDPAFEVIVTRYRRPLLAYAKGLLPDSYAEDVVQQTFVRALETLRRSDSEIQLRPWLYRIAHNGALDVLKANGFAHEELHEGLDSVERPDQAFERGERLREVVVAVGELPSRQRKAIVLRELEGRSYEEIAGELGVTGGAVRQLLVRARTQLRSAASALTPAGFLSRLPWPSGAEPLSSRMVELCATAAPSAIAAKVGVTAVVAGSAVGGAVALPSDQAPVADPPRAHPAKVSSGGSHSAPPPAGDKRSKGKAAKDPSGESPKAPKRSAPAAPTHPASRGAPASGAPSGAASQQTPPAGAPGPPGDAEPQAPPATMNCDAPASVLQTLTQAQIDALMSACRHGVPAFPAPPPGSDPPGASQPPPSQPGAPGPTGGPAP